MKVMGFIMILALSALAGCTIYPASPRVSILNSSDDTVRVQFLPCSRPVPWGAQYSGKMYAMRIPSGAMWTSASNEAIADQQISKSIVGGGVNYLVYSSNMFAERTAVINCRTDMTISILSDGSISVLENGIPIESSRLWYREVRPEYLQEWID